MTHDELCARARRWLSGTRRCNPVFSNLASCAEIPDAIGWSSAYGWYGSTVIECKISVSDFYADKKKWSAWKHPNREHTYPAKRLSKKQAAEMGYAQIQIPAMGDYRFYLCEPGIISVALVAEHAPDHGLIYRDGHAMRIVRPAPRRTLVDKNAEIRYLRFAIINGKTPHVREVAEMPAATLFETIASDASTPVGESLGTRRGKE